MKPTTCFVIPCYNEGEMLTSLKNAYDSFLQVQDDTLLCFVNDGSKDHTLHLLQELEANHPEKVTVLTYDDNQGKAGAVLRGMNHCNSKFTYEYIGYLDADLATSLTEGLRVKDELAKRPHLSFVFGSRIAKLGSEIDRSYFRFLVGRIIATLISRILALTVYDTQCGCKVFRKETSEKLFNEPFISKWLFDVELFFRMYREFGKESAIHKMKEVPLDAWVDPGDSKVSFGYFFKLWVDLKRINSRYKSYK